jgi:hypothetical protein
VANVFNGTGAFMQNKPNFLQYPMNINPFIKKHYGNFRLLERPKNKPKTNPISEKPKRT